MMGVSHLSLGVNSSINFLIYYSLGINIKNYEFTIYLLNYLQFTIYNLLPGYQHLKYAIYWRGSTFTTDNSILQSNFSQSYRYIYQLIFQISFLRLLSSVGSKFHDTTKRYFDHPLFHHLYMHRNCVKYGCETIKSA